MGRAEYKKQKDFMGNQMSQMSQVSWLPDYNPDDYVNDTSLDLNPMNYPNYGNYNFIQAPLKEIITWPMEKQMELSDAICRRYAKNPLFLQMQGENDQSVADIRGINETSVGNAAFMAYHNPNSYWSDYYDTLCKAIRDSKP